MVFFNYALRKLNAKIVYYGPGLCGKTTNLQWIHDNFQGGEKGKMVSLATEGDRTIFFDLLPLDIGSIRGMDVTLQLYTVPGQVHYNSTRQLVLRGADGVVFVADSQRAMQSSNTDSLRNLEENLRLQGFNLAEFPHVLQFNKRDLGDLMAVEEMDAALNQHDAPFFEAVAVEGIGIQESLEGIVRLVMRSLKDRYEARGLGAQPSRLKPAVATGPLPIPGPGGSPPVSGIRPLGSPEAPRIPEPQTPSSAAPFDIEKEPEPVSLDVSQVSEEADSGTDGGDNIAEPQSSESTGVESLFDDVAEEVAPPTGDQAEVVANLEPVSFEEIDTQTGMLIPPSGEAPPDADSPAPADLLPQGPGMPVEDTSGDGSVAQYDTADVDELVDVVPDDDRIDQEEKVSAPDEDVDDVIGESNTDQGYEVPAAVSEIAERAEGVNDLVASILGPPRTESFPPEDSAALIPDGDAEIHESSVEPDAEEADSPVQPGEDVFSDPALNQNLDVAGGGSEAGLFEEPVAETLYTDLDGPHEDAGSRGVSQTPVILDDGDPFQEEEWEHPAVEQHPPDAVVVMDEQDDPPVQVTAGDNSLALKLTGTGAIVESGQVRALDIEVPVPGTWVGNRRVTLQLRLTLLPVTEDENDGTHDPA